MSKERGICSLFELKTFYSSDMVVETNETIEIISKETNDDGGLTCLSCECVFTSLQEQKVHFTTDLHVYNLKRRQKCLPIVQELPDHVSSSSESSESDQEDQMHVVINSPMVSVLVENDRVLKIYANVLLSETEKKTQAIAPKKAIDRAFLKNSFKWIVILLRSGRFAAAVFQESDIICHKAFQRYTTRRKQGGSQAVHDNASGSKAKSAGATLRRYNEAALQQEIQDLIRSWQKEFDSADCIFLSVAQTSRSIFFGGNSPVFQATDPRIRKIPFATQRPTFQEVQRVHRVLSTVYFSPHVVNQLRPEVRPTTPAVVVAPVVAEPIPIVQPPQPETLLVEACNAGDMENVIELLEKENVCINEWSLRSMTTALHRASEANHLELIRYLLKNGADPTIVDGHHRVPFLLCNSKQARDIYRRFRAEDEEKWDFEKANVPEALTEDLIEAKKAKEREKRRKQRLRKKANKQAEQQAAVEAEKQRKLDEEKIRLGNQCDQCAKALARNPFRRLEYKYCSTDCVNAHKRVLMRDAALARFKT